MPIINSVVKGKQPVIEPLNVTPTTSAQTINAPTGKDGYAPVNVSAVTSSIDANIVAGNIKSGVSILGVSGSVTELNGTTTTINPSTSSQTVAPTSPNNGFTEVTVPAVTSAIDANIQAGNIKKDVTILGVTGSFEGGVTPTGTKQITSNGVYDVTDFASADVQVPTTAPAHYIEKAVDANGKLIIGSTIMDFTGVTDVGNYVLSYAYYGASFPANTSIDLSSLTTISGNYSCQYMFCDCTGITSVDLSKLEQIAGSYAFQYAFQNCTGIVSADLRNLRGLTGSFSGYAMFMNCTGLTTVNIGNLITLSGPNVFNGAFQGCSNLETLNLSSCLTLAGSQNMLKNCTSFRDIDISKVTKFGSSTSSGITDMFNNTAITQLRFSGLIYHSTNYNNIFSNFLRGTTNVTVHFPSDWETTMSSWSNITNGMGGTNTTVLFDLPPVDTIDLSDIEDLSFPLSYGLSKITGLVTLDISSIIRITYGSALSSFCSDCSGLTNVKISSLRDILPVTVGGSTVYGVLQYMFQGCTSLTTLSFPALKTNGGQSQGYQFSGMLTGCSGVTVHFPNNLTANIIGASQVENGFGGTNTTVLFDLPATNILNGADSVSYERNPKYDTTTALSWRVKDSSVATTPYYTSGLTDPTVGTTIYSDAACTTAVTTVDSIS